MTEEVVTLYTSCRLTQRRNFGTSQSAGSLLNHYIVSRFTEYTVIPVICIAGIMGNITSAIVIVKSGLRNPTNIFLFGLAVADVLCLIDVLNVQVYVYRRIEYCSGWFDYLPFPYEPAFAVWIFYVTFYIINSLGGRMSITVTVIITLERMVAVFFPLNFSRIITPTRAWQALTCATLFWLPWIIFQGFWFKFYHIHLGNEGGDLYLGLTLTSDLFKRFDYFYFNSTVINHLTHTIPLILVTAGSLAIGIKVRINNRKRQKIILTTHMERSSSRTTKTLLMVCLLFSITRFCYVIRDLPWFTGFDPVWKDVTLLYSIIRERILDMNSACNFFIYVVFNARFRKILKNLFHHRRWLKS